MHQSLAKTQSTLPREIMVVGAVLLMLALLAQIANLKKLAVSAVNHDTAAPQVKTETLEPNNSTTESVGDAKVDVNSSKSSDGQNNHSTSSVNVQSSDGSTSVDIENNNSQHSTGGNNQSHQTTTVNGHTTVVNN